MSKNNTLRPAWSVRCSPYAAAAVFVVLLIAFMLISCGGSSPPAVDPAATPSANLALTAKSLHFEERDLVVPAGSNVTITLDNQDKGINHNFALYTDKGTKTKIYGGDLFAGIGTKDYTFTAPAAGTYFFRCDAHPDTMTGTLVAK